MVVDFNRLRTKQNCDMLWIASTILHNSSLIRNHFPVTNQIQEYVFLLLWTLNHQPLPENEFFFTLLYKSSVMQICQRKNREGYFMYTQEIDSTVAFPSLTALKTQGIMGTDKRCLTLNKLTLDFELINVFTIFNLYWFEKITDRSKLWDSGFA